MAELIIAHFSLQRAETDFTKVIEKLRSETICITALVVRCKRQKYLIRVVIKMRVVAAEGVVAFLAKIT